MGGSRLDRFSRFAFGAFDNPLRGYPSVSVRFDDGVAVRSAATWTPLSRLRIDGFGDIGVARNRDEGRIRNYPGLGAAVEALRLWRSGRETTFIGLDAVRDITYRTTRNENTRCNFCKNNCLRTFIDINTGSNDFIPTPRVSKVPLRAGEQRLIIATCEKGTVEDVNEMREIKSGLDSKKDANPNFVDIAAHDAFKARKTENVADPIPSRAWTKAAKERAALMRNRQNLRIGIPRVLNAYVYAPLFNAYLACLPRILCTRTTRAGSFTAPAPAAAPSIPAFRRRSESLTCTT